MCNPLRQVMWNGEDKHIRCSQQKMGPVGGAYCNNNMTELAELYLKLVLV